jgi:hypothetical protein
MPSSITGFIQFGVVQLGIFHIFVVEIIEVANSVGLEAVFVWGKRECARMRRRVLGYKASG